MREKIKLSILILALLLSGSIPRLKAEALSCPDLRVVFARGSGGERNKDPNYLEYKSSIESNLKSAPISYEFIDLDYPAVGVGIDNLETTIGAYIGAGDSYKFGDSVNTGVNNLVKLVNNECPNTKYVLGGYSQGAMVVSKALKDLNANKIIYAATFGDPKIYLPEGKGIYPDACKNQNLSNYRAYVPDCRAYMGLLGSYMPYQPDGFIDKLGTWCNKHDIFCSPYFNIKKHTAYIADNLYKDAAKTIAEKIAEHFNFEVKIISDHDTVILIDSTSSMRSLYVKFKEEAYRLAKETLNSNGRVALFDYRDLDDPYDLTEHCNFDNCTLEIIARELDKMELSGGGDDRESLLSASFHAMQKLKWKFGATKSLVVLTDDGFLSPDRDGITYDTVVTFSKIIDPVNFYIVTTPEKADEYKNLAKDTDGKVVTNLNELNILTDYIMNRSDGLVRIEDTPQFPQPELKISNTKQLSDTEYIINFERNGDGTIVLVNDTILGITREKSLTISGLDVDKINQVSLVAYRKQILGQPVAIELNKDSSQKSEEVVNTFIIPKAPNTGKR